MSVEQVKKRLALLRDSRRKLEEAKNPARDGGAVLDIDSLVVEINETIDLLHRNLGRLIDETQP